MSRPEPLVKSQPDTTGNNQTKSILRLHIILEYHLSTGKILFLWAFFCHALSCNGCFAGGAYGVTPRYREDRIGR